ncbi:MAG: flagellar biosynthesis anti-sigma factor FlgM [Syntrophaceae bacterium]|nr:flagellar biosynthesis anti-sigma factor FlgM [Syntrophaceae bacterium]
MIQQYQKADKVEDRAQDKPEKAGAANLVPEEKVNLSTTAKDVQSLKNAVSSLPDVRRTWSGTCGADRERAPPRSMRRKVAEKMVGESLLDVLS